MVGAMGVPMAVGLVVVTILPHRRVHRAAMVVVLLAAIILHHHPVLLVEMDAERHAVIIRPHLLARLVVMDVERHVVIILLIHVPVVPLNVPLNVKDRLHKLAPIVQQDV